MASIALSPPAWMRFRQEGKRPPFWLLDSVSLCNASALSNRVARLYKAGMTKMTTSARAARLELLASNLRPGSSHKISCSASSDECLVQPFVA
eukprot:3940533-Amphidinium_carterae.5